MESLLDSDVIVGFDVLDPKTVPFDEALSYTPEEYLLRERSALERHEYHDGRIYAMSGASKQHNLIASNLNYELQAHFRKYANQLGVFQSDLRVHNPRTMRYLYPDIVVAETAQMDFADNFDDTLLNPLVIIEILSKSTENYDRTKKFDAYKGIDSLQEYILVSQRIPHIEVYSRKNRLEWLYREQFSLESALTLHSIADLELRLEEVYAKVNFTNSDNY
jgi:Uma2 family endonuclease